MRYLGLISLLLLSFGLFAAETNDPNLASAEVAKAYAEKLTEEGEINRAVSFMERAIKEFKDSTVLRTTFLTILMDDKRYGRAEVLVDEMSRRNRNGNLAEYKDTILAYYENSTSGLNKAVIIIGKKVEQGDFKTAIRLSQFADERYPQNETILAYWGEALYKDNQIEEAEAVFRKALAVDPLNTVANQYIGTIRDILEKRQSQEAALWINIAKDKVGDFIVTFLALFAAFLVNNMMAPLMLQFKLNQARRLCERGNYDEFTDLIEGLYDQEDFAPLRSNFRFLLNHTNYEESKEILKKYVNTEERLPSLLRILEREHEKMLEAS